MDSGYARYSSDSELVASNKESIFFKKKKNTGEDTGEAVSYTILKFSGIRLVKHSVLRHTPFIFNCFQIKREKKNPFPVGLFKCTCSYSCIAKARQLLPTDAFQKRFNWQKKASAKCFWQKRTRGNTLLSQKYCSRKSEEVTIQTRNAYILVR